MIRLSIVLGSGLVDGLVWAWLASLLPSPIYVAGLGVVAGFMTMLLFAALTNTQGMNDYAYPTERKPVTPLKKKHRTLLSEPDNR